ncbi:MAG: hypothetical protein ABFS32_08220 [Bacteroidota bacterium]
MKTNETKTNRKIYRIYDVDWETDGQTIDLPQDFLIEIEVEKWDTKEDIEDILMDRISDESGWLHNGFCYELIDDDKLKDSE